MNTDHIHKLVNEIRDNLDELLDELYSTTPPEDEWMAYRPAKHKDGYWHASTMKEIRISYPTEPIMMRGAYNLLWVADVKSPRGSELVWEPDALDIYYRYLNGKARLDLQGQRISLGDDSWPDRVTVTNHSLEIRTGDAVQVYKHSIDFNMKGFWVNQPETNLDGKLPHRTFFGDCKFWLKAS